jgi:tRNA 2-selenouridine synthase
MVWLEDSVEGRVERILKDYVIDLAAEFVRVHGEEQGFALFAARMLQSMDNIQKRLGGERHARLRAILQQSLDEQQRDGLVDSHRGWIEGLLREYYDPMYVYQRESKSARIEFAGEHDAVLAYLRERAQRSKT